MLGFNVKKTASQLLLTHFLSTLSNTDTLDQEFFANGVTFHCHFPMHRERLYMAGYPSVVERDTPAAPKVKLQQETVIL